MKKSRNSPDPPRDTVTVAVYTLGCKLNQLESESIAGAFREAGARIRSLNDCLRHSQLGEDDGPLRSSDPAIIVINTCTVTGKAEQKARRIIRRSIRAFPSALIIVTGCYAQVSPEQVAALNPDIRVIPQDRKHELLEEAQELLAAARVTAQHNARNNLSAAVDDQNLERPGERGTIHPLHGEDDKPGRASATVLGANRFKYAPRSFSFHSRAFLKIQDGCDNRCAYCRVPLARGDSVSRDVKEVVDEVGVIVGAGFREIVLTGVNISSFSHSGVTLPMLAQILLETSPGFRLRLSSLEPDMLDSSYDALIGHPRVCPHFHIPVQSGSNAILSAMGRKYDSQLVLRVVDRLRQSRPDAFIAADFITGFPGESPLHHRETVSLIRECGFTRLHVFPFSPRPGTAAVDLAHRVPEREAVRRAGELRTLSESSLSEYTRGFHGRFLEVLLETPGSKEDEWYGVSENYLRLPVQGIPGSDPAESPKGRLCRCRYTFTDGSGKADFLEWA